MTITLRARYGYTYSTLLEDDELTATDERCIQHTAVVFIHVFIYLFIYVFFFVALVELDSPTHLTSLTARGYLP